MNEDINFEDNPNEFILNSIRNGLYNGMKIVSTYMTEGDNPRLDNYQLIKMNRVIMAQLFDISERLKRLENNAENTKSEINSQQTKPCRALANTKPDRTEDGSSYTKDKTADTQIQNEINKDYAKEGLGENNNLSVKEKHNDINT